MLRKATSADSDAIAKSLWNIWNQFKLRQIPSPIHSYSSVEVLKNQIEEKVERWFVCESASSELEGFFSLDAIGEDKTCKRWGFPQHSVRIEYFSCLQSGEALLNQFELLVKQLSQQSILLVIPASLREPYWAALKAGFRQLGESSLIVGGFVWLYFDRENRHEEIQAKLQKAKVVGK